MLLYRTSNLSIIASLKFLCQLNNIVVKDSENINSTVWWYIFTWMFNFADTFFVLATITDDRNQSFQELLPNGGIYLWPTRPIQGIVFECMSTEDNPQIYLSSSNQTSMRSQIGFSQFPTSLNDFLVCRSNTTGEERRIYIASEQKDTLI